MNKDEVLKALEDDNNYYGDFGKKYLSNSDISTLLTNPLACLLYTSDAADE